MRTTKLVIRDQVNCKFEGLDPTVRRQIVEKLKFFVPYARHMPAFKLGRWDGKVGFATVGGGTYVNLIDRVLPLVMAEGWDVELDDQRPHYNFVFPKVSEDMFAEKMWPAGHPMAGQPIMLRDYQATAIKTFLENLQSIQCLATGFGKTLTSAALSALVEPYGRSIVIVPNKSLVEQTEEDYINLGLDVGVFYGDRKEWGKTHTICTWQSLAVFSKKERRGELDELGITMADFLDGVICVMVDEVHGVKGPELRDLLCGPMAHIPIRWGFTGTIPKEDFEFLNLLSALGPVVGEIKAKELQDKGVLANCDIEIIQLLEDCEFADYPSEHKYLMSDDGRLSWISDFIYTLSETGNVLVLIDRISTGDILCEKIGGEAVFVSGATKGKDRKKEYKSVTEGGSKILIATSGVAAVGISITHIDHVVFLSYGKAYTKSIQSIGRGLRKGGDKQNVKIWDICSDMKFEKRHLAKRKEYYTESEYPFKVTKIKYKQY